MFKKILDLKVSCVEDFIRKEVIKRYYNEAPLDDNLYLEIKWFFSDEDFCDTFYVYTAPKNLENISMEKYNEIINCHFHFSMREIYALVTGETILIESPYSINNETTYEFCSNKEYYEILKKKNKIVSISWKNGKRIKSNPPKEILEYIKNNLKLSQ